MSACYKLGGVFIGPVALKRDPNKNEITVIVIFQI